MSYRNNPATKATAVTPHDSNTLSPHSRALYVGTGGNITMILEDDSTAVLFANIPDGTILPVQAKVVKATATNATNIVSLS